MGFKKCRRPLLVPPPGSDVRDQQTTLVLTLASRDGTEPSLAISTTGGQDFNLITTDANGTVTVGNGGTAIGSMLWNARITHIFQNNGSEACRIDSSGRFLMGTGGGSTSAIMQLDSTTQGFLPPQMTTTQRDAISSPGTGILIYNTTTNKYNFYNGTGWEAVTSA